MTLHVVVRVGRVADGISSEASAVTDEFFNPENTAVIGEAFTSAYDTPVQLANINLALKSVTVTETGDDPATFVEGNSDDYTVNYAAGTITVIDGGDMSDATEYLINYTVAPPMELRNRGLVDDSETITDSESTELVKDEDYVIEYATGKISLLLNTDGPFTAAYSYRPNHLATKIDQTLSAADTVHYVCTSRSGGNGVASLIFTET